MKILITGAAGFIGSNLSEFLLNRNFDIIGVDNFDPFYNIKLKKSNIEELKKHKNFVFYEYDLKNLELVESIFSKNDIDLVIHLAAKAGVRPSILYPNEYFQNNIFSTLNILNCMKNYSVKKILFASSSSVYGNIKNVPFNEEMNINMPVSPYAATKISGENICYNYHHLYGIKVACLRFFTVYGPKQRPEMAIANFTKKISNNEEILLFGDGSSKRDFTYISDIIEAIYSLINYDFEFEIFNLGDSKVTKIIDLVNIISENLKIKPKIKYLSNQLGDMNITFADITKAKKMLDYEPKVLIEDGIRKYIEWFNNGGKDYYVDK